MDRYKNFSIEDFLSDKFFNQWVKNASSKDSEIWETWIENNPDKQDLVKQAKQIILALKYQREQLSDNFYDKLKSRIDLTIEQEKPAELRVFPFMRVLKLAAVFIGLVIGAYLLLKTDKRGTPISYISYSSKYAETKEVILPDSSKVVLNANSSITYKDDRDKSLREVWLKGEAFFDVKHIEDGNKIPLKFIVHAKDVNVQVVGTQFNINNIDGAKTEVLLTRGKVILSVPGKSIYPVTMSPHDLVRYNNKTNKVKVDKVSPTNYIAWLDRKYVLEKKTLEDISKDLYKFYGCSIAFKDMEMRKQQLSGTLELQDQETLIKTLSALLGVSVKKTGNQIIIGSK